MPIYNMPEFQRRVGSALSGFGGRGSIGRAKSPYGRLRAQMGADQLARRLQYQRIRHASNMADIKYKNQKTYMKDRDKMYKLRAKEIENNKSKLPWELGAGLGTGLFSWWEGRDRAKKIRAQSALERENTNKWRASQHADSVAQQKAFSKLISRLGGRL